MTHTQPIQTKQNGFTLMELIAVVGIMLLLMALIVPGVATLRERAKRTQCQNNLRQIGATLTAYLDDNRGLFPNDGSEGVNDAKAWFNVLPKTLDSGTARPYSELAATGKIPVPGSGQRHLFICPSSRIEDDLVSKFDSGSHSTYYSSYAMNSWIHSTKDNSGDFRVSTHMRLAQLTNPAAFVVFAESPDGLTPTIDQSTMVQDDILTAFRHNKATNICFADGHAEAYPKSAIYKDGMSRDDNLGGIQWNPTAAY